MKVKVIGAGSIGNHMAQACRRMGWDVAIVDADPKALERTKTDIYPKRYGAWDDAIQLYDAASAPKGGFDIIIIGTPPDSHMKLALAAIEETPRLLHIEKPMATPDLAGVAEFEAAMRQHPSTIVTVGYDHAVAESTEFVRDFATGRLSEVGLHSGSPTSRPFGEILTIDVEFREHWRGIFGAHPWLAGPWETYLGYWRKGGGAGCEHSHALHLWFYFARALGWGGLKEAASMFDLVKGSHGEEYDRLASFAIRTEQGGVGRAIQDVVTYPVKKWVRLQGEKGYIEWFCNGVPEGDLIRYQVEGQDAVEKVFPKKRPDDFYRETLHYDALLSGKLKPQDSPLSFERGLEVMKVLNDAYRQNK